MVREFKYSEAQKAYFSQRKITQGRILRKGHSKFKSRISGVLIPSNSKIYRLIKQISNSSLLRRSRMRRRRRRAITMRFLFFYFLSPEETLDGYWSAFKHVHEYLFRQIPKEIVVSN